jgi:hypothetical protein
MPERTLTDADAEAVADHMTDKLIARLSDAKTVEQISEAWGSHIDRALGKGLRRIGLYVVIGLLSIGAVKLDLVSKLLK